jgi:glycosyltransferase involved in cell wall biosynthesis
MRVTLYRDHPAEGWRSMDRHAAELGAALEDAAPPSWQIAMPMPPDPGAGVYRRLAKRMLRYPSWARGRQGDVNHVLDHSYGHLLFALDPARTVVTVHDLAPLRFPGRRFGVSGVAWRRAWRGVTRARHLITSSEFVAAELRDHLDPARAHIHCIPLGVTEAFGSPACEDAATVRHRYAGSEARMLLHVGRIHARKNLPTLLDAVARLRSAGESLVLVQAGGLPDAATRERIRALDLERCVRFAGALSEPALASLYGAADAFVFPSWYEGFGLPVLEAMACGTPVVASDTASLPELVGDAGLLAPPGDAAAIAAAVRRVLTEPGLADSLRRRGLERVRRFSWRMTAERTLRVYEACRGEADGSAADAAGPARP